MRKIIIIIIVAIAAVLVFNSVQKYEPYERLAAIEKAYGVNDSFLPESREKNILLEKELKSLEESLAPEKGREAQAVKTLIEVRLDLSAAAGKVFESGKMSRAISPYSDNCLPGKPVYEARKLMDEAVVKARNASDRLKAFLSGYPQEAARFGITENYAKKLADSLEETAVIEKNALNAFC